MPTIRLVNSKLVAINAQVALPGSGGFAYVDGKLRVGQNMAGYSQVGPPGILRTGALVGVVTQVNATKLEFLSMGRTFTFGFDGLGDYNWFWADVEKIP